MAFLRTVYPPQQCSLRELYTDTNQPQLLDPCTRQHAALGTDRNLTLVLCQPGYATATYPLFKTDATPHTARPSQASTLFDACINQLLDPCTAHNGPLEYAPKSHLQCSVRRMRDSVSHTFQNRCRSSHRPPVAIKHSIRRLHKHQPASAFGSMHCT